MNSEPRKYETKVRSTNTKDTARRVKNAKQSTYESGKLGRPKSSREHQDINRMYMLQHTITKIEGYNSRTKIVHKIKV